MILQCPHCQARYNVADGSISEHGRKVRCSACKQEWLARGNTTKRNIDGLGNSNDWSITHVNQNQKKSAKINEKINEKTKGIKKLLQPVLSKIKSLPIPSLNRDPGEKLSHAEIIVFACAIIVAGIITAFVQKPELFGYAPTSKIIMSEIALAKQPLMDGTEYAVSGKLTNLSDQEIKTPIIRITLVDKNSSPLQYWQPAAPEFVSAAAELPFSLGPLKTKFTTGDRIVIEIGNSLELALRRKPK